MNIQIINKTSHHEYDKYFPLIKEYAEKTLQILKLKPSYAISLSIVGPITMRRINRDYRHKDRSTDVISFAIQEVDTFENEEEIDLGDIFINYRKVKTQALAYGHSEKREFIFLFVHGLLHCLGYDHIKPQEEKVMFALQRQILGDLK